MQNIIKIMDRDEEREDAPTLLGIKILKYIKYHVNKYDLPPTREEIKRHVKSKGNGGIEYAINKLITSKRIKKKGATRNLWPVENKEQ